MNELHKCITELLCTNSLVIFQTNRKRFYRLLSQIELQDNNINLFVEIIVPKIFILISNNKLDKDLIYLSLLTNRDRSVLQKVTEFEKTSINLDISNPVLLYDYCLYKRQHWLLEIINNDEGHYGSTFSEDALFIIDLLKLINLTNQFTIDTNKIKIYLNKINTLDNSFVDFYKRELKRVLDVIELCQKYHPENSNVSDIFHFASNKPLLKVFSKFVNLDISDVCEDVLQKLTYHDSQFEFEIFTAYNILFSVLHCLELCKAITNGEIVDVKNEITEIINEAELKLLNLKNIRLQIEILEHVFAYLFLQKQHFILKRELENDAQFYCSENEVRLLLMFIKSVSDAIKKQNLCCKASEEFRRFTELDKYLADGLWRLELITNTNYEISTKNKIEKHIVSYMLAPPESLIHLCLKQNDFNKARQVIQIFNLQSSHLSAEISYHLKLQNLTQQLKKAFRIKNIKKGIPAIQSYSMEDNINVIIDEFFKLNYSSETIVSENLIFNDILDIAITQCDTFDECEDILNIALTYNTADPNDESPYSAFCKNIIKVFNEINNKHTASIRDILCNSDFNLDIEIYKMKESLYANLCYLCTEFNKQINTDINGQFNTRHDSHKTFLKMQEVCIQFSTESETKEDIKYLQRFFNYLKSFSKILYIENNNSQLVSRGNDTSYFGLLNYSRSEILKKLLFEKKLDLQDFEQLFSKLKLDLVYYVAIIFFPTIYLGIDQYSAFKKSEYVKPDVLLNSDIITYIQKRNWLLAFILNKMYGVEETKMDLNEIRIKTFVNFITLPRIQALKCLFQNNEVVTVLQQHITPILINKYFDQHIIKSETEASQHSTSSLETGREVFEGDFKITNWRHLFEVIDSIPQSQLQNSKDLLDLRDMVLSELVNDCFESDYFKYVQFIVNDHLRWECILNSLTTWPGEFCLEMFQSELSRYDKIDEKYEKKFTKWFEKIQLYEEIRNILQKKSWFKIYLQCKNNTQGVLRSILNTIQVDVLLKFMVFHKLAEEDLELIDENYFLALFDSNIEMSKIQELLIKLPSDQSIKICYALLKVVRKLEYFNFITDYISSLTIDDNSLLRNIQISLKILSCFNGNEHEQMWCLITQPLNILEMLIMNTKLDKLGQVLEIIRPDIENCEFDENFVSIERIDELLRVYAEKSLEFRVILQPGSKLTKTSESSKLLQSLDSLNFPSTQKCFVMPENVPLKSEWVQNHEVTECMCCMETTFSMFNRRHHCRRCGRVVCGSCSLKRMEVPTYENIKVRVCIDCYEQSRQDITGGSCSKSEMSTRSNECDYWLLSDDQNHNQVVRGEFSYEYAPSVSLCLAILKFHSNTEDYPKFLLDQCDSMLQLLQPTNSDSIREIDYLLVIKMLKSLAIAAKMLSAQCMLQWGSSLADRILSQADLLGLLAERGCLHLIPACGPTQGRYIDASILRRLRDKLLEGEQWNLALEVSTKAGLDNTGVFAAWGKSYLKAGSLQLAREKFQRCFDKTAHYEASTDLSGSFSNVQMQHSKSPQYIMNENRPTKNPPLLNEIIQILESNTCVIDAAILNDVKNVKPLSSSTWSLNSSVKLPLQNDPAVCILNKLKNLSNIAAGNYCTFPEGGDNAKSLKVNKAHLENIFYEECVYYLTKYGTHMSLLEFYVKHEDIHECLKYMLQNHLTSEIFIDIYMLCLGENSVTILHKCMSKIDSTLDVWKEYLKCICRHLEKSSKLHSLYQLQQFMGDFIRAAMTCIKFYQDGATTFTELTSRVDYLHKAQQHLQQELEQEQWVEVASVRKSNMNDSQESFEAKGIVNPSLVMKMDSRNVDKHINTIWRQIEIAEFLAECELSEKPVLDILPDILPFINEDLPPSDDRKVKVPTLFGSYYERVQLAVLAIVCGIDVEDGFSIAFKIIHDHKLNPVKVYCQAGKQLAKTERYTAIAQLVSCIRSSGTSDSAVTNMCDEMLILAVQTLTKSNATGSQVDGLIKLITDKAAKISAYIETKQLKSAYLLAVKHKRIGDIRRILREAEFLNQPNIKMLCQKILYAHSHSPSHSKD